MMAQVYSWTYKFFFFFTFSSFWQPLHTRTNLFVKVSFALILLFIHGHVLLNLSGQRWSEMIMTNQPFPCHFVLLQFIRAIYYQLKHGFQHTQDNKSGEEMGNSLFLDEAWFSKDIFLYHLSKVILPSFVDNPTKSSWLQDICLLFKVNIS